VSSDDRLRVAKQHSAVGIRSASCGSALALWASVLSQSLDVEIWPTCVVLPAGFCLALTLGGRDFARPGDSDAEGPPVFRGSGLFLHTDPDDRPAGVFDGRTTIHTGPGTPSHVLLPAIAGT
jgi:hypothetical protein